VRIYRFTVPEGSEFVISEREDEREADRFLDMLQSINGTPRGSDWSPVRMKLVHRERGRDLRSPLKSAKFAVLRAMSVNPWTLAIAAI
jgi:hypothetical protein